jgi:hypothetical protein
MWDVDVMPLHFHSEKAPTEAIYQGLLEKGWLMLGLVNPPAITIALDPAFSSESADLLIADLREVTEKILVSGDGKTGDIRYA